MITIKQRNKQTNEHEKKLHKSIYREKPEMSMCAWVRALYLLGIRWVARCCTFGHWTDKAKKKLVGTNGYSLELRKCDILVHSMRTI